MIIGAVFVAWLAADIAAWMLLRLAVRWAGQRG